MKIKDSLTKDTVAMKTLEMKFKEIGWIDKNAKEAMPLDLMTKFLNVIEKYPSQYLV